MAVEADLVLCLCPGNTAKDIASSVLEKRLAASVEVVSKLPALFGWDNGLSKDEALLLITTADDIIDELYGAIQLVHPSDRPVITTIAIDESYSGYLDWLEQQLISTY
jgi:periplasmic divalent cation tolerance protein